MSDRSKKLLVVAAKVVLTLALTETLVRLAGVAPWRHHEFPRAVVRPLDPEFGWRNAPGHHRIPSFTEGAPPISLEFMDDGSRVTGPPRSGVRRKLLLLGGSWTQGAGVPDAGTFAWRLQQRFLSFEVVNHGTAGYGTYQSLLLLEREIREVAPALVLYGFIDHHVMRNVANPVWVYMLAVYGRTGQPSPGVPYVTLGSDGALERHAPASHPHWPLREWLATVNQLQNAWAKARGRARVAQAEEVTRRLLLEMRSTAESAGARFAVVLLHFNTDAKLDYQDFLAANGISAIDCDLPFPVSMRIPGDVHPNADMHRVIGDCIADALERSRLAGARTQDGSG